MNSEHFWSNPLVIAGFAIAAAVTFAIIIGAFAIAARRLLGIEVGKLRMFVAGFLGYVTIGIAAGLVGDGSERDPGALLGLAPVILGGGLIVSMVFLIVGEIVFPSGTAVNPIHLWRSGKRTFGRSRRYTKIVGVAIKHGLGPYLRPGRRGATADQSTAVSLRKALQDCGVTFVKIGQLMSTRADLLPPTFIEELSRLQDKVPAAPWAEVEHLLTVEFGGPPKSMFAEFDPEPFAAASVAQVHLARLLDGREVVVKVQRPGIRKVVERDLDIVRRLGRMLEARTRWGRALGATTLADGFAEALLEELDFRIEVRNLVTVRAAAERRGDQEVRVPEPYPELCTERVLVMERLSGTSLREADMVAGVDLQGLARSLLATLLRQVMIDGTFHADPHPGNVMLVAGGHLALLDFGSVGRVDSALRESLQDLLMAIDRADPVSVRDALLELVDRQEHIDEQQLERSLGRFMARHLAIGARPDLSMFGDLFAIVSAYGLAVHPEVAAVFRALATLEGTLGLLAPGFDIVEESRRFAKEQIATVVAGASTRDAMTAELLAILPVLRRLPRRIDRLTSNLEQGRLGINVRLLADERDRSYLERLLHQVVLTFLGAVAGVMGVMLLGTPGGPQVTKSLSLYDIFGYNLFVASALLVLRVLVLTFRPPGRY